MNYSHKNFNDLTNLLPLSFLVPCWLLSVPWPLCVLESVDYALISSVLYDTVRIFDFLTFLINNDSAHKNKCMSKISFY